MVIAEQVQSLVAFLKGHFIPPSAPQSPSISKRKLLDSDASDSSRKRSKFEPDLVTGPHRSFLWQPAQDFLEFLIPSTPYTFSRSKGNRGKETVKKIHKQRMEPHRRSQMLGEVHSSETTSLSDSLSSSFRNLTVVDRNQLEQETSSYKTWLGQHTTKLQNQELLHGYLPPALDEPYLNDDAPLPQEYIPEVDSRFQIASLIEQQRLSEEQAALQKRLSSLGSNSAYYRAFETTSISHETPPEVTIDLTTPDEEQTRGFQPLINWKKLREKTDRDRRQKEIEQKQQKLRLLTKRWYIEDEQIQKQIQAATQEKAFPSLSKEEQAIVKNVLKKSGDELVSSGFGIQIKGADIRKLKDCEWLNDEVINFFLNLVLERNKKQPEKFPNCHLFNTHFYRLLSDNGYQRVARWTRKPPVDLFTMDKVVVPIHLGNHWCLAVINLRDKKFEYYDSLGGTNPECLSTLRDYLIAEHKEKKKKDLDLRDWTDYTPQKIPHQKNGYDCGVFMCRYAECVMANKPFNFGQQHMDYFRKRMVLDIHNKVFSY